MKEKPLPMNSTVDSWPWEHFKQEYFDSIWWARENSVFSLGI